jgi:hypothetical protein
MSGGPCQGTKQVGQDQAEDEAEREADTVSGFSRHLYSSLSFRDLARTAKLHISALCQMETTPEGPARGHARNVQAVIDALARHGVQITEDGVRVVGKPKKRR